MKFFKKFNLNHGGVLHDNGDNITNMPELEKLKASKRMHKDVGKYFAPYSPEEVRLINQRTTNENIHI